MSNFVKAAGATSRPAALSHQMAAWNYAWDLLTVEEQATFLDKFRSDPAPKAAKIWEPAAKLIREFEGFESSAYPDPGTGDKPWTIGWGFTSLNDALVKKGDSISREDADALLDSWIETKVVPALAKTVPGWGNLAPNRQNALVSFAWNVGWHFCGSADFVTISKCLRESDYDAVPSAMLLYINPGSSVEAGLRRRREAEGKLWGITAKATSVLLKVPYEAQNDNKSGTGYRECFSSSCAMIAKFYGKVKSDDEDEVEQLLEGLLDVVPDLPLTDEKMEIFLTTLKSIVPDIEIKIDHSEDVDEDNITQDFYKGEDKV